MSKPSWPPYGSNFSRGTTDAIGVLVETFNDCENSLRFILLSFMKGNWLLNHLVIEHMSSTAIIEAIHGYLSESPHKARVQDAVEFAIKSFETCRANRNSIVHFGMAWRQPRGIKSKVFRVKLRKGRQALMRTIKPSDVRAVADACHYLKVYLDDLSTALDAALRRKPLSEPTRPAAPSLLAWVKEPY